MIKKLVKALREDDELRQGYVANIAMPFYDAHRMYQKMTGRRCSSRQDLWIISNAAAEYFVDLLSSQLAKTKGDGSYIIAHSIKQYLKKSETELITSRKKSAKMSKHCDIENLPKTIKKKVRTSLVEVDQSAPQDIMRVRAKNPNKLK